MILHEAAPLLQQVPVHHLVELVCEGTFPASVCQTEDALDRGIDRSPEGQGEDGGTHNQLRRSVRCACSASRAELLGGGRSDGLQRSQKTSEPWAA